MRTKALTINGQLVDVDDASLEALRTEVLGPVILPADREYDEVRKVWNGMIDRRPALIVRCTGTADVVYTVRFAKKHGLLLSVRGAGHNIAGRALHEDVLLLDLSLMRAVHVDPESQSALVSAGATLKDIDHETQAYGLALPMGINSTTGIAGLTLGGGFGWLSRSLGLTVDNLLSAEVVTVAGDRITCSAESHPDLFWALQGGGGQCGIVTAFRFQLHPVGPQVMCGPVVFPIAEASTVLSRYRDFCKESPDELTIWSVLRQAPPFPFIDASHHGKPVLILVGLYNGPMDKGEKLFSALKKLGSPLGDGVSPHRFVDFQQAFDPLLTPGARNYWKTHNFKEISDGLIAALLRYAGKFPSGETEIFLGQMGGKTNTVAKEATAYPHRDVAFIMNVHTRWRDKKDDQACIAWARAFHKETSPFATGGAYVNFLSEGDENIEGAFAENAKKLARVKAEYDPGNVLRFNLSGAP